MNTIVRTHGLCKRNPSRPRPTKALAKRGRKSVGGPVVINKKLGARHPNATRAHADASTPYPNAAERKANRATKIRLVRELKQRVPELRDPRSPLSRMIAILDVQYGPRDKYREPWHTHMLAVDAVKLLRHSAARKAVTS